MNIDYLKKENYQRAFFFKKVGYLFNCFALINYRKRNFLWIYDNEMSRSYIEIATMKKTLEIGRRIFSNEFLFNKFEKGFRGVIEEAREYIKKAKDFNTASVEDLYDLRAISSKMFYFFEKTEFFFTDECYKGEMTSVLKRNLLILGDDLKMKSRPLLVELLTTVLYHIADLAAQEYHLELDDIKFYSFNELAVLLESGVLVKQGEINERKISFAVYSEDDNSFVIEGKEKEEVLRRFKEEDHTQKMEFKGITANKGKVTARVRVFLPELNQDYNLFIKKLHSMEMGEGEILVTETTSPDFVPLMKRAGGIIANQGGLNSHAAIMSRELGVPCLVGTYHATDILKTGDLVELDATNGIVRIINKEENE
jgi:phosphohistidine swiveling domain-containing protein